MGHIPRLREAAAVKAPALPAVARLQEWLVHGTAAVYSAGYASVGLGLLMVPVAAEGLARRRVPWRRGPLDVYLLALALVMVLSGLLSPFRGVATGSAVLMALTIYFAFGVPFRILTADARVLPTLVRVWYAGGVGAAILALIAYARTGGPQAAVPELGPNALASTLAVALVLGAGLVWSAPSRARYAVIAGAVLIALTLALTTSRGAWIGAAVGLVAFVVLAWRGRARAADDSRRRGVRAWALLAIAGALAAALVFVGGDTDKLRKKVLSIPNLFVNRERVYLARTALAIAADHPLIGSGLNTFSLLYPHPSLAAEIPAQKRRARTSSFAHNIFLNMAAEGGILGLAAFTALLIRGTAAGWRWVKSGGADRISSAAVFAAFIALIVHQQFDGTILSVHLSVGLWFLLAMMTAGEPSPVSGVRGPGSVRQNSRTPNPEPQTSDLVVLAVDPGRDKCGIAVLAGGPRILARGVVPVDALAATAARWVREFGVNSLALGDRTGREDARAALAAALPDLPIAVVDEAGTTEAARVRYFADHPPRGWRRLIPTSMQVPPEPYDDYVAVLLAERSLASASAGGGEGSKDGTVGSWRQEEKP